MEWDLGAKGLLYLLGMSAIFAVGVQLVMWRSGLRWAWLIGGATYFVAGLFVSEVWFGWATEEDLQPNIDGLSRDEVLLLALWPAIAAVLVARFVSKRKHHPPVTGLRAQHN
jgi:hypothetical protein